MSSPCGPSDRPSRRGSWRRTPSPARTAWRGSGKPAGFGVPLLVGATKALSARMACASGPRKKSIMASARSPAGRALHLGDARRHGKAAVLRARRDRPASRPPCGSACRPRTAPPIIQAFALLQQIDGLRRIGIDVEQVGLQLFTFLKAASISYCASLYGLPVSRWAAASSVQKPFGVRAATAR